jgi:hypothetical protein
MRTDWGVSIGSPGSGFLVGGRFFLAIGFPQNWLCEQKQMMEHRSCCMLLLLPVCGYITHALANTEGGTMVDGNYV